MHSLRVGPGAACIRYHDLPGDGVPIVFVHGLGCASSCDFVTLTRHSALAGRRLLLVDLLGSGFSDRPPDAGYTVEHHAAGLAALVFGLAAPHVDLFGHSMGGAVAIEAATKLGTRARRLLLGEPNLDAGGGVFSRPIAAQDEAEYVRRGHDAAVRQARADGNDLWAASLLLSYPPAVHRAARSLVRGGTPSWREQLLALALPRTVFFGARSLPDPDAQRLPALGVAVQVVADAGHSMAVENPAGVAQAVAHALA